MQGQRYYEIFPIKGLDDNQAGEVKVEMTIDHDAIRDNMSVDGIGDLARQIAEHIDGELKGLSNQ